MDACRSLGDGSACMPCKTTDWGVCEWERDERGELVGAEDVEVSSV